MKDQELLKHISYLKDMIRERDVQLGHALEALQGIEDLCRITTAGPFMPDIEKIAKTGITKAGGWPRRLEGGQS